MNHLCAKLGVDELPEETQVRTYVANLRKSNPGKYRQASKHAWMPADFEALCASPLWQKLEELVDDSRLTILSESYDADFYFIFTVPRLVTAVLEKLVNKKQIKLSTDGTHSLVRDGFRLICFGVQIKSRRCPSTTSFKEVLFALVASESRVTYTAVFNAAQRCWRKLAQVRMQRLCTSQRKFGIGRILRSSCHNVHNILWSRRRSSSPANWPATCMWAWSKLESPSSARSAPGTRIFRTLWQRTGRSPWTTLGQTQKKSTPGGRASSRWWKSTRCGRLAGVRMMGQCVDDRRRSQSVSIDLRDPDSPAWPCSDEAPKDTVKLVQDVVHLTRFSTPGMFDLVWQSLLDYLQTSGEGDVATALERHYVERDEEGVLSACWCGCYSRCAPGYASGSQSQENWHKTRLKSCVSLRMTVPDFFESLHGLLLTRAATFRNSSERWLDVPSAWDTSLLAGDLLRGDGRTTAEEYMQSGCVLEHEARGR